MGGVCLEVLEFWVGRSCQLFALDKTLIISMTDVNVLLIGLKSIYQMS